MPAAWKGVLPVARLRKRDQWLHYGQVLIMAPRHLRSGIVEADETFFLEASKGRRRFQGVASTYLDPHLLER